MMRLYFTRKIKASNVALLLLYTLVICTCTFVITSTRCQRKTALMTERERELAEKLSQAASQFQGGGDLFIKKKDKETLPKHHRRFKVTGGAKKGKPQGIIFAGRADCPIIQSPLLDYLPPDKRKALSTKDKILALSEQKDFILIEDFFTPVMKKTMTKLGEGVFGEVYSCYTSEGEGLAIKIMPIDGKQLINEEKQKTFAEILPEMVISKELSDLGRDETAEHYTKNFVQLYRLGIGKGKYPEMLLNAWDDWDEREDSDNDRPDIFSPDQLFVMFGFKNSGCALEAFTFHNIKEAKSVLAQIAGTLAVGEAALQFEHRDMHRGNILVRRTKEKEMTFVIDSKRYVLPSEGVHVTVIDYTLSRVSQPGGCISYNDLNNLPWLFKGKGDIQHQTYLRMQNSTHNDWSKFAPKTNAYWLHYISYKMSIKSRVKNVTKRQIQLAITPFIDKFLNYESAKEIFLEFFSHPSPLREENGTQKG